MNVHHLELFYHVARYGGIMPAVRNIPYGIQQPAVSSQIAQLEEFPFGGVDRAAAGVAGESGEGIAAVEELWERDRIETPLISLPAAEAVARSFQEQLRERGVDWFPSIEVSSLELIETYVSSGLEAGVALALPGKKFSARVRALPLTGFPPMILGALWGRRQTPWLETVLNELKLRAQRLA